MSDSTTEYAQITVNQLSRIRVLQTIATSTEYEFDDPEKESNLVRREKQRTIRVLLHDTDVSPCHWRIEGSLFREQYTFKVLAPSLDIAIDNAFAQIKECAMKRQKVTNTVLEYIARVT